MDGWAGTGANVIDAALGSEAKTNAGSSTPDVRHGGLWSLRMTDLQKEK
jgi:hypothetical protein